MFWKGLFKIYIYNQEVKSFKEVYEPVPYWSYDFSDTVFTGEPISAAGVKLNATPFYECDFSDITFNGTSTRYSIIDNVPSAPAGSTITNGNLTLLSGTNNGVDYDISGDNDRTFEFTGVDWDHASNSTNHGALMEMGRPGSLIPSICNSPTWNIWFTSIHLVQ